MKNIVLLSGCHGIIENNLKVGLAQPNIRLYNFALGSTSIQRLYEIKRHKEIILKADLIIVEASSNEIGMYEDSSLATLSLNTIYRNAQWLYEELALLNKKVVVLIVARLTLEKFYKPINNIHLKLGLKYGFNIINTQEVFSENKDVEAFYRDIEGVHHMRSIMRELGKNIANHIDKFHEPKIYTHKTLSPSFEICTPKQMQMYGAIEEIRKTNSVFNEITYELKEKNKLKFPAKYDGYLLVGFHTWHTEHASKIFRFVGGSIEISNHQSEIIVDNYPLNNFHEIQNDFLIDKETFVAFNVDNKAQTEFSWAPYTQHQDYERLKAICVIAFFLAKDTTNQACFDFKVDANDLENEMIYIPKKYDFTYLTPDIKKYKEIMDEYYGFIHVRKLTPLQNENANLRAENKKLNDEIVDLKNEFKTLPRQISKQELVNLKLDESVKKLEVKKLEKELGMKLSKLEPRVVLNLNENLRSSAVARVRNHLAYRLGAAIIVCNKSFFGICSLPFVLKFIKAQYKKEQAAYQSLIKQRPELKLPALENYADYEAGLKEKECFTYKLGLAMMRADKTWLSGGYIKFYFEAKKLEREFKNNQG